MRSRPSIAKYIPFVVAIVLVLGYALFELRGLLIYSPITINEPRDWSVASSSLVLIRGESHAITKLFLNGRQIFTNEDGTFAEELLLPKGYSILELSAEDKFERSSKKLIHIYRL